MSSKLDDALSDKQKALLAELDDKPKPPKPSVLDDPEWRKERSRKAAIARNSPMSYARSLVKDWPELTADQKSRIKAVLRPIVAGELDSEVARP